MENDDIIEKTEGPTPWVSLSLLCRNQKLQTMSEFVSICELLPRQSSENVISPPPPPPPPPIIDDVIADLNDAKVFSNLTSIKVITNSNSQKVHAMLARFAPMSVRGDISAFISE
jgi:hypothetical protein